MKSMMICAVVLISQAALAQMPDLSKIPTSIPQVPAGSAAASASGTTAGSSAGSSAGSATASLDAKSMLQMASDKAVVHLNSATPAQIAKVPGLSGDNVSAIVAARPFKSVTDLAKVKGIGPALYAKIKPYVKL